MRIVIAVYIVIWMHEGRGELRHIAFALATFITLTIPIAFVFVVAASRLHTLIIYAFVLVR